jgi:adenosylhomocysteinase
VSPSRARTSRITTAISDIADPALAEAGRTRIEWADAQMPVLRSLRERFAAERPLEDLTVAACLHVTAETAALVRALVAGGARVALCAANPLATQDEVAAALAQLDGVEVFARRGEDLDTLAGHVADVLERGPQVTLDDGADLLVTLHAVRPDLLEGLIGGTEETTSGLVRLRAMQADGRLACPVLAVNEARAERVFNDHYGTGQSTLDGILRATNLLLAGRTVVVLGYGPTGRGIALRARGAGAQVVVCEIDPIAGLDARMEGFEVLPSLRAAERGDIFITVTGAPRVLSTEHFERMKDGAVLANAGHFDVEIDLGALRELAGEGRRVRPLVEQHTLPDGRHLNLLASGRVVNLAAGEGHPASVMDLSFALQALSVQYLAGEGRGQAPGVHPVPDEIDREVARLKLASLGVQLDELTEEQRQYLRRWE